MTVDLDHVALAAHDVAPVLSGLVGRLGASIERWGATRGFRAVQSRVGPNGMTVEVIEPFAVENDDFLVKYLERRGEGLHHLTFVTGDLAAVLRRLEDAGFAPARVSLDGPVQRELFLSPAPAHGTVVQVIERILPKGEYDRRLAGGDLPVAHDPWWPELPEPARPPAVLRRAVVRSRAPAEARRLFVDLLGGRATEVDDGVVDVRWRGGTLRIEAVGTLATAGLARLECGRQGPEERLTIGGAAVLVTPSGVTPGAHDST